MKKIVKENNFIVFDCLKKKFKENQITLNFILKLFSLYIDEFK